MYRFVLLFTSLIFTVFLTRIIFSVVEKIMERDKYK